jgi:predicted glycosyl hydrolase (DUF1957 family)
LLQQNSTTDIAKINGYWEIEKVFLIKEMIRLYDEWKLWFFEIKDNKGLEEGISIEWDIFSEWYSGSEQFSFVDDQVFWLSNTFHEMDEEIVTPDAGLVVVNMIKKNIITKQKQ